MNVRTKLLDSLFDVVQQEQDLKCVENEIVDDILDCIKSLKEDIQQSKEWLKQ